MEGTENDKLAGRLADKTSSPSSTQKTEETRKSIDIRIPAVQYLPEDTETTVGHKDAAEDAGEPPTEDLAKDRRKLPPDDLEGRDKLPPGDLEGLPAALSIADIIHNKLTGRCPRCKCRNENIPAALPPPSPLPSESVTSSRMSRPPKRLMTPVLEELVPSSQDAKRLLYHAEEVAAMDRDELEFRLMEVQGFNINQEETLDDAIMLLTEEETTKTLLQREIQSLEDSLREEKQRHFQQLSNLVQRETHTGQMKVQGGSTMDTPRPFTTGGQPLKQQKMESCPGGPLPPSQVMESLAELRERVSRLQTEREAELVRVRTECEQQVAALRKQLEEKDHQVDRTSREFRAIKACMEEKLRERDVRYRWLQEQYQACVSQLQDTYPLGLPTTPNQHRRSVRRGDTMEMQLLKRRSEKLLEEVTKRKDCCATNHSQYVGHSERHRKAESISNPKKNRVQKWQFSLSKAKKAYGLAGKSPKAVASHPSNKASDEMNSLGTQGDNQSQSLPSFQPYVPQTLCITFHDGRPKLVTPATSDTQCLKVESCQIPPVKSSSDSTQPAKEKLPSISADCVTNSLKSVPDPIKPVKLKCISLPQIKPHPRNNASIPRVERSSPTDLDPTSFSITKIHTQGNNEQSTGDVVSPKRSPRKLKTKSESQKSQESVEIKRSRTESRHNSPRTVEHGRPIVLPPLS